MNITQRGIILRRSISNGVINDLHLVFNTLEYLITVQHLSNVHNGKLHFMWLAKKDNLITFSIKLNAQHVNGMTPFDLAEHKYVRLLDTYSRVKGLLQ